MSSHSFRPGILPSPRRPPTASLRPLDPLASCSSPASRSLSSSGAGAQFGRSIARRLPAGASPPTYGRRAATAAAAAKAEDNERCSGFLPWLRSKAGTSISSVLHVGASPLGRSLFASQPIREGDCMMEVPHCAQLTEDKLPDELRRLLDDGVAGDTTKIAVLLMMEKHLGQESGWAPYIGSLPCKDQMHNMMFWDVNELHMVRNSSICEETIIHKEQVRKQFSAVKLALERFPCLFGEIKVDDFMHTSALGTYLDRHARTRSTLSKEA